MKITAKNIKLIKDQLELFLYSIREQNTYQNVPIANKAKFVKAVRELGYYKCDVSKGKANRRYFIFLDKVEPIHARRVIEQMNKKPEIKKCTKCGKAKQLSEFYKNPQTADNLSPYCKECAKESARLSKRKNRKTDTPDLFTHSEKIFKKPTIAEIHEYCRERGNNINATKFYYYYESKGWKVGKSKMKDWKSAVITWELNQNTVKEETAICNTCKKEKPLSEFNRDKSKRNVHSSQCKECKSKYMAERRLKKLHKESRYNTEPVDNWLNNIRKEVSEIRHEENLTFEQKQFINDLADELFEKCKSVKPKKEIGLIRKFIKWIY